MTRDADSDAARDDARMVVAFRGFASRASERDKRMASELAGRP
jgi:hypothetical protein